MDREYSAYDAKARFSEVLRAVMAGDRVVIRYRGKVVAQVVPHSEPPARLVDRLPDLVRRGVVDQATGRGAQLRPVATRAGALGRFLDERD